MTAVPIEPRSQVPESGEPDAGWEKRVDLPIVQFCSAGSRLQVFGSAEDAVGAARTFRDDKFYDAQGNSLKRIEDESGSSRLAASGGAGAEPQRRLTVKLGGAVADSIKYILPAMTLAVVLYDYFFRGRAVRRIVKGEGKLVSGDYCKSDCTWREKLNPHNNCC